jgi:hypothetical protein
MANVERARPRRKSLAFIVHLLCSRDPGMKSVEASIDGALRFLER